MVSLHLPQLTVCIQQQSQNKIVTALHCNARNFDLSVMRHARVDCTVIESFGFYLSGTIKRWNHHRGLMTHGSKSKRQHGSIGMSATPSRVLPGLKMAGHMGAERVKIRKLEVSFLQALVIVTHVQSATYP